MKEKRILINLEEYNTRALTDDQGRKVIEGYASVFNQRSRLLFENGKTFYEVIERNAFEKVLGSPELDVILTYEHEKKEVLSRLNRAKGVENLSLSTDDYGLKFRALLNNSTIANDTYARVQSKDLFETSFVFTVSKDNQRWERDSDGNNIRYIKEVSALYDVSIVTNGAYAVGDLVAAERSMQDFEESQEEKPVVEEVPDTYYDQLKIEILKLL